MENNALYINDFSIINEEKVKPGKNLTAKNAILLCQQAEKSVCEIINLFIFFRISTAIFHKNENNKYNFIYELKQLDLINDYSWTIKYINKNENDIEGFLIIGDYPHIYDNKNYNEINLRST